jgi:hypothetical protein
MLNASSEVSRASSSGRRTPAARSARRE